LKPTKDKEKQENQIPFKYYRTAIAAISRYHKDDNNRSIFRRTLDQLQAKVDASAGKPGRIVILKNNIRAILNYERCFARRQFVPKPSPQLVLGSGEVLIGAKPDLVALEEGRLRLIRFDMKKRKPNPEEVQTVLAITLEAANAQGLALRPNQVMLLRLEDCTVFEQPWPLRL
jgi:hypothetical protein